MRDFILPVENLKIPFVMRSFEEFHGITACIITLNEEERIVNFLEKIKPLVKDIIMIDGGSDDRTIQLAMPYIDTLKLFSFKGHFANQKNRALMLCRTDWVLFLDLDETMSDKLCESLPSLINQDKYDCYAFPRREFINGKERENVYPDYQDKLFRTYCRYVRPVHEELVGHKSRLELLKDTGLDIFHRKEMQRHNDRNGKYRFFQYHYYYEEGEPGKQKKETCPLNITDLDKTDKEFKEAEEVEKE